ncbi:MAG: Gfo/Idh/MocA family protein [Phycisphaerae bacterium]
MADESCVVVGAGGISRAWFPPLKAEGVKIAAVVDLNLEAARNAIAKHELDAEPADDLEAALRKQNPDFVVDLTVPDAHAEVTCTALEAGCHVVGEKPMAGDMDQALRMVQTAEKTGRMYMVSQSRRWEPHHESIRRAVADGLCGRLGIVNCDFYIGAHFGGFRAEMESPLVLDMAIHHFDLARMFSGADPVAVYAHEFNPSGSWYAGDAAASCIFEMTDGVVFTYRGCWCAEGFQTSWNGDWQLTFDNGGIRYEQDQQPTACRVSGDEGFIRPREELAVPPVEMEHTTMHGALREMLAFLRNGTTPQTECHDNIKSLAMVFGAMRSSREKRRVVLK